MVDQDLSEFMENVVAQAADYELISTSFVEGLEAMAKLLKHYDASATIAEHQDFIDAMLLHAAGEV